MPDLDAKPELKEHLTVIFKAFGEIANREGGITMYGVNSWLDLNCIEGKEQRLWIFKMVSALDNARIEMAQEK